MSSTSDRPAKAAVNVSGKLDSRRTIVAWRLAVCHDEDPTEPSGTVGDCLCAAVESSAGA